MTSGTTGVPDAPPPPLAADEVARHAVRMIAIARGAATAELHPFSALPRLLRAGDVVVVNDAATLPAALAGRTARGEPFELRLTAPIDGLHLVGAVLGSGDWRTRTEHRPPPPPIEVGGLVQIGGLPLASGSSGAPTRSFPAMVTAIAGRRIELDARLPGDPEASRDALWQAIYATGAPVQYAHRRDPLALWSVQTAYAARPWAAEMPSAGRPLTWDVLIGLARAGIAIATLTHAAGLGSIGDPSLDRALPWPERYDIPERTAALLAQARARGGRVIAIGTTVVRALESAAGRAGTGTATLRLDARSRPRVVDGLVSGLHVPGESHFELLRAFAPADLLARALELARAAGLSGHELGDGCLIVP